MLSLVWNQNLCSVHPYRYFWLYLNICFFFYGSKIRKSVSTVTQISTDVKIMLQFLWHVSLLISGRTLHLFPWGYIESTYGYEENWNSRAQLVFPWKVTPRLVTKWFLNEPRLDHQISLSYNYSCSYLNSSINSHFLTVPLYPMIFLILSN